MYIQMPAVLCSTNLLSLNAHNQAHTESMYKILWKISADFHSLSFTEFCTSAAPWASINYFFGQIWLCLLHIAPCLNSFCWFVSWNICRFYPGLLINQCSEHHCINSAHFYLFSKSCNIYRNATVAFKDTKKRLLFDFEHLPMEVSLCPCFTPIWQGFLRIRGEFSCGIHGVFFWFVYSSIEPRESHLSFTASERSFRYDLW